MYPWKLYHISKRPAIYHILLSSSSALLLVLHLSLSFFRSLSRSLLELMWCLFGPKLPDHFFTCFFFSGKSLEERRLHRGIALLKGYCHLDKNTFFRPLCLPFLKPFGFHLEAAANPPRYHYHTTRKKRTCESRKHLCLYCIHTCFVLSTTFINSSCGNDGLEYYFKGKTWLDDIQADYYVVVVAVVVIAPPSRKVKGERCWMQRRRHLTRFKPPHHRPFLFAAMQYIKKETHEGNRLYINLTSIVHSTFSLLYKL